jgi:hypothetical protein
MVRRNPQRGYAYHLLLQHLYIIMNIATSVPIVLGRPMPMLTPRAITPLCDKELAGIVDVLEVCEEVEG